MLGKMNVKRCTVVLPAGVALAVAALATACSTDASASAGGRSGPTTSGLGAVEALTLEANPGFGRMYVASAQADASPGPLSSSGASCAVDWNRPELRVPYQSAIPSGPLFH
jgi:hypothetical protein